MMRCICGHDALLHHNWTNNCLHCICGKFTKMSDQAPPRVEPEVDPQEARMERIAVALESIARSLDAMRRDGR